MEESLYNRVFCLTSDKIHCGVNFQTVTLQSGSKTSYKGLMDSMFEITVLCYSFNNVMYYDAFILTHKKGVQNHIKHEGIGNKKLARQ